MEQNAVMQMLAQIIKSVHVKPLGNNKVEVGLADPADTGPYAVTSNHSGLVLVGGGEDADAEITDNMGGSNVGPEVDAAFGDAPTLEEQQEMLMLQQMMEQQGQGAPMQQGMQGLPPELAMAMMMQTGGLPQGPRQGAQMPMRRPMAGGY